MSSTCPHNMVSFGPLAAEICWRVWGIPINFSWFRDLASNCTAVAQRRSTKLCTMSGRLLSWGTVYTFFGAFPPKVQVLRSPILAALNHYKLNLRDAPTFISEIVAGISLFVACVLHYNACLLGVHSPIFTGEGKNKFSLCRYFTSQTHGTIIIRRATAQELSTIISQRLPTFFTVITEATPPCLK